MNDFDILECADPGEIYNLVLEKTDKKLRVEYPFKADPEWSEAECLRQEKAYEHGIFLRVLLETSKSIGTTEEIFSRALAIAIDQVEKHQAYRVDECATLEEWLAEKMTITSNPGGLNRLAFIATTILPALRTVLGPEEADKIVQEPRRWGNLQGTVTYVRDVISQGQARIASADARQAMAKDLLDNLVERAKYAETDEERMLFEQQIASTEVELNVLETELIRTQEDVNEQLIDTFKLVVEVTTPGYPHSNVVPAFESLVSQPAAYGGYYLLNQAGDVVTFIGSVPLKIFMEIENQIGAHIKFTVTDPVNLQDLMKEGV